ncbi:MAG: c-type cytochrome [Planctomycetota bacterium]|nr:c-type cytochrome [Planctomycetota bacterium]
MHPGHAARSFRESAVLLLLRRGWVGLALAGAGVFLAALSSSQPTAADTLKINSNVKNRIELGRRLFYEPLLSRSGARSCASCHAPEHGFSDPDIVSRDDTGTTRRHSQTIVNSKWNPSAHWDGEFASVEELVTRRLGTRGSVWQRGNSTPVTPRLGPQAPNPVTPSGAVSVQPFRDHFPLAAGFTTPIVSTLGGGSLYAEGFRRAFGSDDVTLERIALAIAAYCYSVEHTESAYDRYRGGDKHALSLPAKRGMLLFEGRAGCATCHTMKGKNPLFTDYQFHNTGVTYEAIYASGAFTRVVNVEPEFLAKEVTPAEDEAAIFDRGRIRLSEAYANERAFKTPTLRDVALRAPYMHNGALASLEEVVRWYGAGCGTDPDRHTELDGFTCTEQDVQDLVAFLESLTGDERPGLADSAWAARAQRTRLTILAGETPLAGVDIKLIPVGDPVPITTRRGEDPDGVQTVRTDARGQITFRPGGRTHMRVVLPADVPLLGSALVPDTCRKGTLYTDMQGEMKLLVRFPEEWAAPPVIIARPTDAKDASSPVRTTFRRVGEAVVDGVRIARYRGWVRGAEPHFGVFDFPGLTRTRRGAVVAELGVLLEGGTTKEVDLTSN